MSHAFFIQELDCVSSEYKVFFPFHQLPPPHYHTVCFTSLQPLPSPHAHPATRTFLASIIEINGIDPPGVNGFCCQGEEDAL